MGYSWKAVFGGQVEEKEPLKCEKWCSEREEKTRKERGESSKPEGGRSEGKWECKSQAQVVFGVSVIQGSRG